MKFLHCVFTEYVSLKVFFKFPVKVRMTLQTTNLLMREDAMGNNDVVQLYL